MELAETYIMVAKIRAFGLNCSHVAAVFWKQCHLTRLVQSALRL